MYKVFFLASLFFIFLGCSSDRPGSTVTYTISGTTVCNSCVSSSVVGVQMELLPKGDPLHSIGVYSFDDLGPFTINNVTSEEGRSVEVNTTVYLSMGGETISVFSQTEISPPDSDNEVVSTLINLPQ